MRRARLYFTVFLALFSSAGPAHAVNTLSACVRLLERPDTSEAERRAVLDRFFERLEYQHLDDLKLLEPLRAYFKVREIYPVDQVPEAKRIAYLNEVFRQYSKLPKWVRDLIYNHGRTLDLVLGNVTNHPDYKDLKGVVVPRYRDGSTYDVVAGIADDKATVAVDARHGSANIILHELAHVIESIFKTQASIWALHFSEMKIMHKWSQWGNYYYDDYVFEAFAEAFALFFDSEETRKKLFAQHPVLFRYIQEVFLEQRDLRSMSGLDLSDLELLKELGCIWYGQEHPFRKVPLILQDTLKRLLNARVEDKPIWLRVIGSGNASEVVLESVFINNDNPPHILLGFSDWKTGRSLSLLPLLYLEVLDEAPTNPVPFEEERALGF